MDEQAVTLLSPDHRTRHNGTSTRPLGTGKPVAHIFTLFARGTRVDDTDIPTATSVVLRAYSSVFKKSNGSSGFCCKYGRPMVALVTLRIEGP